MSSKDVTSIVEQTVLATAALLGIGETELSYTKASAKFGNFFRDMVKAGRLQPRRVGNGRNGTHRYAVSDILALKREEEAKAKLM